MVKQREKMNPANSSPRDSVGKAAQSLFLK
jgi:hypothetical protein